MPICPVCEKDDRTFKVSAVHAGGISHGTFSGTEGPVSGTSQTVLSTKLAPLPKPTISCFVLGCGGLLAASGIFQLGSAVLAMYFALSFDPELLKIDDLGGLLGVIAPGVVILGIGLSIYILAIFAVKRKIPHWTTSMNIYDQCYYCDRDGIVFDPKHGATIPINGFNDYLKQW